MFRTLYGKLAAVLFGLFCLVGVLFLAVAVVSTRLYVQEANQRLNRELAQRLVSEGLIGESGQVADEELKTIFHTLMVVNPSIEVYLLDARGKILAFSAPPEKIKAESVSLEAIRKFLEEPDQMPVLGDDPRHLGHRKIFSAAPVEKQGAVYGYLYVILAGEQYESVFEALKRSHILRLGAGLTGAGLLFVFGAGLVLFKVLTRPLRRLDRNVEVFQRSVTEEPRRPMRRADEIESLESSFEAMSERIREQLSRLRDMDAERRQLFTNVSHDLRTPLSSLQGHLETVLMKGEALSPDDRRGYLSIALKNSQRLSVLVSELLELAKLEAPEIRTNPEPFSLPELVQDVVQEFQVALEERGVRFDVRVEEALPFAWADIGLVERVLENLLQNAARHTPPGSVVTVDCGLAEGLLETRVSDQGSGIDPDDFPLLFERFYRGRKGASPAAEGTGLGLTIAKRITELHGGRIWAFNRPVGGATFAFTLPAAHGTTSADGPQLGQRYQAGLRAQEE